MEYQLHLYEIDEPRGEPVFRGTALPADNKISGAMVIAWLVVAWSGAHACVLAAEPDAATETPLEEVTLTAQKRAERLQEASLAVVTLTATRLRETGATTFEDMQSSLPTLTWRQQLPVRESVHPSSGAELVLRKYQPVGCAVSGWRSRMAVEHPAGDYEFFRTEAAVDRPLSEGLRDRGARISQPIAVGTRETS